jgi:IS30 family transposase
MRRRQPLRRPWTPQEEEELWRLWKDGRSMAEIAHALGRQVANVHGRVHNVGGIAPRPRRRAARHLSLEERELISRGLSRGLSIRDIAADLGRSPSTISREVNRNEGRDRYRAARADENAWARGQRYQIAKLNLNERLFDRVLAKLQLQWSPQQIAGWLKRRYPNNPRMHVSHETIYRTLYMQASGALKAALKYHLRRARYVRRARLATDHGGRGRRKHVVDGLHISERPAEVEDRAVPGHWEGDLLFGDAETCMATLVERTSRFTLLVKLKARDSKTVAEAVAKHVQKLPLELRRSLTWDRGSEMARHKEFKIATDLQVYFCDPYSPWQRGSNENTNGLLRQYFPKGEPVGDFTQAELNQVARRLNGRPRKTLDFRTPAETFSEFVALSS